MAMRENSAGEAEEIKKEFKQFVYGASHDLNACARGMVEFSRLIAEEEAGNLSDEGKLYLSMIIENGQKLQAILDGLVKFSRLNTMAQPFTKFDVNIAVKTAMQELGNKIRTTNSNIKFPNLPEVYGDQQQVVQLFSALLSNSLKFVAPGQPAEIDISVEENGNEWLFKIRDNGIGIQTEFSELVFEPFKRLNADTDYPGAGIGLALAKKVVDDHGTKIWLEPSPTGTCIAFTLPAQEK